MNPFPRNSTTTGEGNGAFVIAIASGKGGTGKTTIAVNLALSLTGEVCLMDCDVEAPNTHLFLGAEPEKTETVYKPVPRINRDLCNGCGECSSLCRYHAIAVLGGKAVVFNELCHSCGGCARVCPARAITTGALDVGVIEYRSHGTVSQILGRLSVGKALPIPVIREVKKRIPRGGWTVIDGPPGTSCPMTASVKGSDYVILVTEPTPFGLHDLQLAAEVVRVFHIPFGVIINRSGPEDGMVEEYCRNGGIPILMSIPEDRRIAEAYSRGLILVDSVPGMRERFLALAGKIVERLAEKTGVRDREGGR